MAREMCRAPRSRDHGSSPRLPPAFAPCARGARSPGSAALVEEQHSRAPSESLSPLESRDVESAGRGDRSPEQPSGVRDQALELRRRDEEVVEPGCLVVAVADPDPDLPRQSATLPVALVVGEVVGIVRRVGVEDLRDDPRAIRADRGEAAQQRFARFALPKRPKLLPIITTVSITPTRSSTSVIGSTLVSCTPRRRATSTASGERSIATTSWPRPWR